MALKLTYARQPPAGMMSHAKSAAHTLPKTQNEATNDNTAPLHDDGASSPARLKRAGTAAPMPPEQPNMFVSVRREREREQGKRK